MAELYQNLETNTAMLLIPQSVGVLANHSKTTGYYVPKEAEEATREGVTAWQKLQECLRALAELNKNRNLQRAREAPQGSLRSGQ